MDASAFSCVDKFIIISVCVYIYIYIYIYIYLTNRFHVAVRLFSSRSKMTSKCGKNKKVAHEGQPLCLAKNCDWFKFKKT